MAQGSAIASTITDDEAELAEIDEFEEPGEELEHAQTAEMEARARRQGWRPIDEYRGEPGRWVDAETFLKRGENFLPFVQKQLREANERSQRMEGEITSLRTDLTESRQVLQELRKFALNANKAGYDRARAEIEGEMRTAVTEGDVATYDSARAKLEALEEGHEQQVVEAAPPQPERPQPRPQVRVDEAVEQFVAENPWFNTDPQLNAAMQGHHVALKAERPGLTLVQNLAEAKKRVMAAFPEKFGLAGEELEEEPVDQPRRPASPLPPSQPRRPAATSKGFDRITDAGDREEAKRAYAQMKRHDPELTVEDYLTIYENPRADVIEMRKKKAKK